MSGSFATFASFKRESSEPPSLKSAVFVDDFHIEGGGGGAGSDDASPAPASPGRSSFRRISGAIRAEKEQQSTPQQSMPEQPRTKRLSLEEQLEMVAPTAPPPSAGGWDAG